MKIFDGLVITSGGGRQSNDKWMPPKFVKSRIDEWVRRSLETAKTQPEYDFVHNWVPHQCLFCFWFGAIDDDYGFCFCTKSPNEGRITFEHGGCEWHSNLQPELVTAIVNAFKK